VTGFDPDDGLSDAQSLLARGVLKVCGIEMLAKVLDGVKDGRDARLGQFLL
jgi:hypothetical protein